MFQTMDGLFVKEVSRGTELDPLVLEPNLVRGNDGSLIMIWTAGGTQEPEERNHTCIAKSFDSGRTWVDKRVLFSHPRKGMFTPAFYNDNGTLLAFPGARSSWTAYAQDYNAFLSVSRDHGNTFSTPASLPGCINHFLAKSCLRLPGRLLVSCSYMELDGDTWIPAEDPSHAEMWAWLRENHSEYCGVLIKEDTKDVWRLQGHLGYKGGHFTEPYLIELSDGTLVMMIRLSYELALYKSVSHDRGETWSEIEKTDIPSAVSKTCLVRDAAGRIYLLFNPGPTRRRAPLSVWVSSDDMKTWSVRRDLLFSDEPDDIMTYRSALIDEERHVLCFGWENRRQIFYSELPLETLLR